MTKSHDFITLSDKLSWIKMLNLLSVNERCEELPSAASIPPYLLFHW